MNLEEKVVWDLSLDEIEYVYRNLHMNHYVYAALKTYHTSSPPLNRLISLRSNTIPAYLCEPVERLLGFSPYIGTYDPSLIRAGITYCTYLLYSVLHQVQAEDASVVAQLLASCAYLSICSEKNDNLPLWRKLVVRHKGERIAALIEKLLEPAVDIEEVCMIPLFGNNDKDKISHGAITNLFKFIPRALLGIIMLMENGDDPQLIERALLHTEQAMRTYEYDNRHSDTSSPIGTRQAGQVRYRNTIYLYGGMFFEKQGRYDCALDWYLKDINVPELPNLFGFFLTNMKTTERLISAYSLTTGKEMQSNLENLIHLCLARSFQSAAEHSRSIIDYFISHPSTDMRIISITSGEKRKLYAGEASREIYFISLLYNKFILGIDYQDIDYARFFKY